MREIWNETEKWSGLGKSATLATVISVSGSSLRPAGSKMAISSSGEITGSVTGGCVEGAIFEIAKDVAKTGIPQFVAYGVTNEQAWEVGLSCGGSVKIFVESMNTAPWITLLPALREAIGKNSLAVMVTVINGPGFGNKMLILRDGVKIGSLGDNDLNTLVESNVTSRWGLREPLESTFQTAQGEVSVFMDFILPPPRLIIIGASHIAIPLVTLANALDFQTIVVDARSAFATRERFPHADELIVGWPAETLQALKIDPSTCVVCLSHDDKQDNPALLLAIESEAQYIGALGSKTTHAKRLEALLAEGAAEEKLTRIHAPVGLKLGAKQPAEIALAIMAEIVAAQHGY